MEDHFICTVVTVFFST